MEEQGNGSVLATKAVEEQSKGSVFATKAVEKHGYGSALATAAVEMQGKSSGLRDGVKVVQLSVAPTCYVRIVQLVAAHPLHMNHHVHDEDTWSGTEQVQQKTC